MAFLYNGFRQFFEAGRFRHAIHGRHIALILIERHRLPLSFKKRPAVVDVRAADRQHQGRPMPEHLSQRRVRGIDVPTAQGAEPAQIASEQLERAPQRARGNAGIGLTGNLQKVPHQAQASDWRSCGSEIGKRRRRHLPWRFFPKTGAMTTTSCRRKGL